MSKLRIRISFQMQSPKKFSRKEGMKLLIFTLGLWSKYLAGKDNNDKNKKQTQI